MKKQSSKKLRTPRLIVSKTTIRNLGKDDLNSVAGGIDSISCGADTELTCPTHKGP